MPLRDLLSADRIAILADPGDRAAVLDAAARLLAQPSGGFDRPSFSRVIGDKLRHREALASTGIGHGVAIPHGRIDGIETSRGAFLRLLQPVDFGAADGEPVDLVLAMAAPEHAVQRHLELLADVAERFADPGYRAALRDSIDLDILRRLLLDDAAPQRKLA